MIRLEGKTISLSFHTLESLPADTVVRLPSAEFPTSSDADPASRDASAEHPADRTSTNRYDDSDRTAAIAETGPSVGDFGLDRDIEPGLSLRDVLSAFEKADAMLPLVQLISVDLVRLARQIDVGQWQIQGLEDVARNRDDSDDDEMADVRRSIQRDGDELERTLAEAAKLGLIAHRPIDGGFDFRIDSSTSVASNGDADVSDDQLEASWVVCWQPGDPHFVGLHRLGDCDNRSMWRDVAAAEPAV